MKSRRFLLALPACMLLGLSLLQAQSEEHFNKNQRILRIRQLAKTDPHVIPTLTEFLSDPDADIRLEAVRAIVRLGTERSLDPLITATRDKDDEVEIDATNGLVNFYLPGYVPKASLTGKVTQHSRQVKALFSSRNDQKIAADVEVRSDVGQALGDLIAKGATFESRANAARAAGILRVREAVPGLQQGLRSKDTQLILESLIALQKIGDESAGAGVAFLANDLNDRVQMTALETLGILHNAAAGPELRICLRTARDKNVRRAALRALAMLGLPDDRAIFKQYASGADPYLRQSALEGIGRIRDPDDTTMLKAAFDERDADWRVHIAAAFGLVSEGDVSSGDFSALTYLIQNLIGGNHPEIAEAYLSDLAKRDDVRKALLPLVAKGNSEQKQALCRVLGETRSEDVIPVLTAMSKDIDPAVSLTASRSLRIAETRKP